MSRLEEVLRIGRAAAPPPAAAPPAAVPPAAALATTGGAAAGAEPAAPPLWERAQWKEESWELKGEWGETFLVDVERSSQVRIRVYKVHVRVKLKLKVVPGADGGEEVIVPAAVMRYYAEQTSASESNRSGLSLLSERPVPLISMAVEHIGPVFTWAEGNINGTLFKYRKINSLYQKLELAMHTSTSLKEMATKKFMEALRIARPAEENEPPPEATAPLEATALPESEPTKPTGAPGGKLVRATLLGGLAGGGALNLEWNQPGSVLGESVEGAVKIGNIFANLNRIDGIFGGHSEVMATNAPDLPWDLGWEPFPNVTFASMVESDDVAGLAPFEADRLTSVREMVALTGEGADNYRLSSKTTTDAFLDMFDRLSLPQQEYVKAMEKHMLTAEATQTLLKQFQSQFKSTYEEMSGLDAYIEGYVKYREVLGIEPMDRVSTLDASGRERISSLFSFYRGDAQVMTDKGEPKLVPWGFGLLLSGDYYQGWWKEGKRHGYGVTFYSLLTKADRLVLTGEGGMLPDLVGTTSRRYEGGWLNDRAHGWGISYWPNGRKLFIGTWKNGEPAEGIEYTKDGEIAYLGPYTSTGMRDYSELLERLMTPDLEDSFPDTDETDASTFDWLKANTQNPWVRGMLYIFAWEMLVRVIEVLHKMHKGRRRRLANLLYDEHLHAANRAAGLSLMIETDYVEWTMTREPWRGKLHQTIMERVYLHRRREFMDKYFANFPDWARKATSYPLYKEKLPPSTLWFDELPPKPALLPLPRTLELEARVLEADARTNILPLPDLSVDVLSLIAESLAEGSDDPCKDLTALCEALPKNTCDTEIWYAACRVLRFDPFVWVGPEGTYYRPKQSPYRYGDEIPVSQEGREQWWHMLQYLGPNYDATVKKKLWWHEVRGWRYDPKTSFYEKCKDLSMLERRSLTNNKNVYPDGYP